MTDRLTILTEVCQRLQMCLSSDKSEQDPEHYHFIPLREDFFIEGLDLCLKHLPPKENYSFLEVGSGIGAKSMIASMMGFQTTSIEINTKYIELFESLYKVNMRSLVCHSSPIVVNVDALEYDEYDKFDVVYFWTPFRNWQKQLLLETKIVNSLSPNSIIYPAFHLFCHQDLHFEKLDIIQYNTKINDPFFTKNRFLYRKKKHVSLNAEKTSEG